jgi:uncharacterized protein YgiB involved in biofilm formation
LLGRRGDRRRCRERDDHGEASQQAYSAWRDHPGSLYARKNTRRQNQTINAETAETAEILATQRVQRVLR